MHEVVYYVILAVGGFAVFAGFMRMLFVAIDRSYDFDRPKRLTKAEKRRLKDQAVFNSQLLAREDEVAANRRARQAEFTTWQNEFDRIVPTQSTELDLAIANYGISVGEMEEMFRSWRQQDSDLQVWCESVGEWRDLAHAPDD
jgi:23S rRNA maturation mini-RNase III